MLGIPEPSVRVRGTSVPCVKEEKLEFFRERKAPFHLLFLIFVRTW